MLQHRSVVRILSTIAIGGLLSACSGGGSTGPQLPSVPGARSLSQGPSQLAAQGSNHQMPRYIITDLGTLGGRGSAANNPNDGGSVAGSSTLRGDERAHAFLWRNGEMSDLGTLGGPDSNTFEHRVLNANDAVTGFSETTTRDPNGEDICGSGTRLVCRAFLWQHGVMTALPTLGGNNAQGEAINNRGQVIGQSETRTPMPCPSLFLFVFKAVIWERGEVHALPTLPGDQATLGSAINDVGQAVGTSGSCLIARHNVLWQNGTVFDLGSLGGTDGNLPSDINDKGEVVGESNLAGNTTHHAFLWRHGVMTDLGTLPGDVQSSANSINNNGQVVGFSFDASLNPRGVLWQDGLMADFNTLIPASSGLFVQEALGINDRGQVAGFAAVTATGDVHAFLATPCDRDQTRNKECEDRIATASQTVLPENVRKMLRERMARWHPVRRWGGSH